MSACIIPKVIGKLYPDITNFFVNPELVKAFFFKYDGQIFYMIVVPGLFNDEDNANNMLSLVFLGFQEIKTANIIF